MTAILNNIETTQHKGTPRVIIVKRFCLADHSLNTYIPFAMSTQHATAHTRQSHSYWRSHIGAPVRFLLLNVKLSKSVEIMLVPFPCSHHHAECLTIPVSSGPLDVEQRFSSRHPYVDANAIHVEYSKQIMMTG